MNSADSGERYPGAVTRAVARVLLTIYGISLALIALWPVPVDANAGRLLRGVTRILPALTYARIEFAANILLFVPLGVLLMLILRRRYLILPIAIVVTVAIECSQGLLLDRRTPSVLDILANTAGACVGMLLIAMIEGMRSAPAMPLTLDAAGRADQEVEKWAALGIVLSGPPPLPPVSSSGQVEEASPPLSPAAEGPATPPPHPPQHFPPMPPPPLSSRRGF